MPYISGSRTCCLNEPWLTLSDLGLSLLRTGQFLPSLLASECPAAAAAPSLWLALVSVAHWKCTRLLSSVVDPNKLNLDPDPGLDEQNLY